MTHLPSICDDFGTMKLPDKLARYQPGWWATWNDIDPRILEALHVHYSLEQVASFHALDDPDRNVLVLFKLHPLSQDRKLDPTLRQPLAGRQNRHRRGIKKGAREREQGVKDSGGDGGRKL